MVNYDGFELDRDVEDAFVDAVKEVGDRYFHGVTRFATSAFMRAKLGDALGNRGVAPHIYESEEEAKGVLKERSLRPVITQDSTIYELFRRRLDSMAERLAEETAEQLN